MDKNIYNVKEIPFKELKNMGISKEAFLDLPKNAIDRLLTGRLSPLMMLRISSDKQAYSIPAKIALVRENGEVGIKIFPKRKEIDNSLNLSDKDMDKIKKGETIRIKTDKEDKFVQLDPETKTLMSAKAKDIHIPDAIGNVIVGGTQKEQMLNGNPVQIEVGDTKVTVGVDLNDRTGFKVINGDLDLWRQKKLIEWDRVTPGATGYWITSENGWEFQKHIEKKKKEDLDEKKGLGRGLGFKL